MRGPFEGLAEALMVLFWLAAVGTVSVAALLIWGVWVLLHHLKVV